MSAVAQRSRPTSTWRLSLVRPQWSRGAPAALVVLVLVNIAFTPGFATAGNLWNLLLEVVPTVLVTVGMTLVIATGGIDLSVGSIMAVASAVAVTALPYGPLAGIAAGLAAGAALGLLNAALVARFDVEPFIATLAVQITGRGLAQVVSHEGQLVPFSDATFEALGRGRLGPVPIPTLIAAVVVALALFGIKATVFGRYLVAVGGNTAASRVAGVPIGAVRATVYILSGLLAALAGLCDTARLGTTDPSNVGGGMEFIAIAAVVIGGTPFSGGRADVIGSVVGVLILAVIGAGLNMHLVPFAWGLVVQAVIILLAVYLQRPAAG